MRKIVITACLLLSLSLVSFANADNTDSIYLDDVKTELLDNNFSVEYQVVWEAFDHCTVTVTITYPSGNSYSATATNNQGDCGAAENAALNHARMMAFFAEN